MIHPGGPSLQRLISFFVDVPSDESKEVVPLEWSFVKVYTKISVINSDYTIRDSHLQREGATDQRRERERERIRFWQSRVFSIFWWKFRFEKKKEQHSCIVRENSNKIHPKYYCQMEQEHFEEKHSGIIFGIEREIAQSRSNYKRAFANLFPRDLPGGSAW